MGILEDNDFAVQDIENLRLHYARTLECWLERFERASERIAAMYGDEFVRMWRLYLTGSCAAFRIGSLQLFQVLFTKAQNNQLPWTRAHMYAEKNPGNGKRNGSLRCPDRGRGSRGFHLRPVPEARGTGCPDYRKRAISARQSLRRVDHARSLRRARTGSQRVCLRTGAAAHHRVSHRPNRRVRLETRYGHPVSYGIRRCEFDHYLALRSGARLAEGTACEQIEKRDGKWIVNGNIEADVVVGAGGHFCPVARFLGTRIGEESCIAAQEIEFQMTGTQRTQCAVEAEIPELYFCLDMRGYGWVFRKQNYLNIGLGRLDRHHLSAHVDEFLSFLVTARRIPADFPSTLCGHAYLLYNSIRRNVVGDGILLIGDAAGLSFSMSGEGIRPAIESALLAAKVIIEARSCGRFSQPGELPFAVDLPFRQSRFRLDERPLPPHPAKYSPFAWPANFWPHDGSRSHVVLNRWFLRNGFGSQRV